MHLNLCCLIVAGGLAGAANVAPPGYGWPTIPSKAYRQVATDPSGKTWPWLVYKSSPFNPPYMNISSNGKPLADGYVFMTPNVIQIKGTIKQNGNFIRTSDGDLVFGQNVSGTSDFRKQNYRGASYLTYWTGNNTDALNVGHGDGEVVFLDNTYNKSIVVNPKLPINTLSSLPTLGFIDIHEHQLTPRNTILVTAYNNTPADLSSVGGPKNGWIADGVVFEIDVATQKVLFQWRASDHVPFSLSKQPISNTTENGTISAPWDWFHINSIAPAGDNYLINSRHTWAFFLVNRTGDVLFTFEGETGGSFAAPPANGTFRWQHHVRAHNLTASGMDISFFDNHNNVGTMTGPTKQLVYHLSLPAHKSVVPQLRRRILTPSAPLYAGSQGSYVPDLGNGNQFVGYGQLAISREYGPATDGSDLRWQAQFGPLNTVQSYRGFKETWAATPAAWDPDLVLERSGKGATAAYVSWNGATEVEGWHVYAGNAKGSLRPIGVAERKGFETTFVVPGKWKYVQVAAVQEGKEVRRSNVAAV